MQTLQAILTTVNNILNFTILKLGNITLTPVTIIYLFFLLIALFYITKKIKKWMVEKILANTSIELGTREAVGSIIRYISIGIGIMIILQTAGIDITTVLALTGAIGIGIGLGLQNIANNFISGIIILFERPIKIGDRVQLGDIDGDVRIISPRATTITTNDNIDIIIPNSEFISSRVVNWSYRERKVRFNFPIGVSYNEDPEKIRDLLIEVAKEHSGILIDPPPRVLFQEFGDSSLNFLLSVWTEDYIRLKPVLRSELNYAISKKFKEHNIEVPFPQRDLHLRSGTLEIKNPNSQIQTIEISQN